MLQEKESKKVYQEERNYMTKTNQKTEPLKNGNAGKKAGRPEPVKGNSRAPRNGKKVTALQTPGKAPGKVPEKTQRAFYPAAF